MSSKRTLGLSMLTALVVGNMVGSGVFLLPASLAQFGTISIFSWIVTAVGALFLAFVFARLSHLFPKTGGPYVYCYEGFGEFVGFQVAYGYWLYMWIGNAAIAVACTGYLSTFFPQLTENNLLAFLVTAGIVWFFTLVNTLGTYCSGIFQLILTIFKFIPLVVIGLIGVFFIDTDLLKNFNVSNTSNMGALTHASMLTLWAFVGLESASIPADNVKNPEKTIPRATILGTVLATLVYILSTIAIMGVIPMNELRESSAPFADFAGKICGEWGRIIIALTAVVSCAGALNGWILLQGQIPLAAAKDHLFPKKFGRISKKGVPIFGMMLSSLLVTVLLAFNFNKGLVDQFTFIISLATLVAIVAYLYTAIVEFTIHLKYPLKGEKKRTYKNLIISAIAFTYVFFALIGSGMETVFYGTILLFTSVPIYGWMKWKQYHKKYRASL